VQLFRRGLLGLAAQRLLQQFGADAAAELHDQFLHVDEGGAPGRAVRPVQVPQQVFRRALDQRSQLRWYVYLLGG